MSFKRKGSRNRLKLFGVSLIILTIIIPSLIYLPKVVFAATCEWNAGSGAWETAGNWTNCGGGVPGASDDVVIDANVTVTINASTTINSLTLGNSGGTTSSTLNFNYDAIGGTALIIDDGNLTIYKNAVITHTGASNDTLIGSINIDVQSGNADIQGYINVDYKGYDGGSRGRVGYGPGAGNPSGSSRAGGAGYGSKGSDGDASGGVSYGSLINPTHLGSGGAGGGSTSNGQTGGSGAGAIKLIVGNNFSVTNSGTITANGQNGVNDGSDNDSGGGSGGTIYIEAANISGNGIIRANGGTAYDGAGAGSGGRVVLKYSGTYSYTGTLTSNKGSGGWVGYNGSLIVLDTTNNDLYIKGTQRWDANSSLEGTTYTYRDIKIQNNSTLYLKGYYTTGTNGVGMTFNVRNFEIDTGSSLNGNSFGYAGGSKGVAGIGPGAGQPSGSSYGGGAGHGGRGAAGAGAGGTTYGYLKAPVSLGSGGAGGGSTSVGNNGAPGGGAITINATTNIINNGAISVNGGNGLNGGNDDMSGAGSGGSIYFVTVNFAGDGSISANGGNGVSGSGGGGGGRISIKYSGTNTYTGTVAANKGTGSTGGENGTVITTDTTNNDLYINNTQIWRANPTKEGNSHTYRNVNISNGATFSYEGYYTNDNDGVGVTFNVTNFTLDNGSTIFGDGMGFNGGGHGYNGYGPGKSYSNYRSSGASHGGVGAISNNNGTRSSAYDELTDPVMLGSGSAGGGTTTGGPDGADGGGAIKIIATGTVTINGEITMDGDNGSQAYSSERLSGGGSGGSVNIVSSIFTGTGTISADGGDGYTLTGYSGGGGGGRIVIKYTTNNSFSGTITADKGQYGDEGENGTVLYIDTTNNALTIKNSQAWHAAPDLEGGEHYYRDITITNNSVLRLQGYYTTNSDGVGFIFSANNFTLDAGSEINGDYAGYDGGANYNDPGDGPGASSNSWRSGGAGYGGAGADATTSGTGGPAYGSETEPVDLGSGSGGAGAAAGGPGGARGGGAIKISATGDFIINGTISMVGENGFQTYGDDRLSGGGAGGSIWLIGNSLEGSGVLTVAGGDGYSLTGQSGGGSGGRIAVHYTDTLNWTGTNLTPADAAPKGLYGNNGDNGTVYVNQISSGYIENLDSSLDAVLTTDWQTSVKTGGSAQLGIKEVGVADTSGKRISDMYVYFNGNRDWNNVTADIDMSNRKSFMHVPGSIANLDGYDEAYPTFDLYIPKDDRDSAVRICPGADQFTDITIDCAGGYNLTEASSNVTIVQVNGDTYWKISGMTSTGGLGINTSGTPNMRVDLGNDATSATDDIEVWFDTPTDITADSLIYIIYDSLFTGGSSLTLSDISLNCDDDGELGGTSTGMTALGLTTTEDGYLVLDTNTDACNSWIQVDIQGGGGNHLTNPGSPGNYSWAVLTDVGGDGSDDDSGAVLAYVGDDNDVNVTAIVPPTIDMELYQQGTDTELTDTNTCALGVLSLNQVNTCIYDLGTGTNNSTGVSVYMTSDGSLDDGNGNNIGSPTGAVTSGEEEYGFYLSELGGGEYTAAGSYSTQHQAVPTSATLLATTSTTGSGTTVGSSSQHLEITHAASMSTSTIVGSYNQVVTYTAYTN